MRIKYLLFDLDGTIVDSADGIIACTQKALYEIGEEPPAYEFLKTQIGPPISKYFKTYFKGDEAKAKSTMQIFRKHYLEIGVTTGNNILYNGVLDLLSFCKKEGYTLFVVTMKAADLSEKILEAFGILSIFKTVYGNDHSGSVQKKSLLIQELINNQEELQTSECLLIGDRQNDIHSAKEVGIRSIGVTWGYGTQKELKDAGADFVFHTPIELETFLKRL